MYSRSMACLLLSYDICLLSGGDICLLSDMAVGRWGRMWQWMRKSAPIAMARSGGSASPPGPPAEAKAAWGGTAIGGSPPGASLKDIQVCRALDRQFGPVGGVLSLCKALALPQIRSGLQGLGYKDPWQCLQAGRK